MSVGDPTGGRTTDLIACAAKPLRVGRARYGRMRPRRCSEKARRTQRLSWSASSRVIGKTSRVGRLSGRRAFYWTGLAEAGSIAGVFI